jgi:hypothetical protein
MYNLKMTGKIKRCEICNEMFYTEKNTKVCSY